MRGASFLVAVTFAAEIGDVRRFDTPAPADVVPRPGSGGKLDRRDGDAKGSPWPVTGAPAGRWSLGPYRYPARVGETLRARLDGPMLLLAKIFCSIIAVTGVPILIVALSAPSNGLSEAAQKQTNVHSLPQATWNASARNTG